MKRFLILLPIYAEEKVTVLPWKSERDEPLTILVSERLMPWIGWNELLDLRNVWILITFPVTTFFSPRGCVFGRTSVVSRGMRVCSGYFSCSIHNLQYMFTNMFQLVSSQAPKFNSHTFPVFQVSPFFVFVTMLEDLCWGHYIGR